MAGRLAQAICASARVQRWSVCARHRYVRALRSRELLPRRACPGNADGQLDDGGGQRLGGPQQRFDDAPAKGVWSSEPSGMPSMVSWVSEVVSYSAAGDRSDQPPLPALGQGGS